MNTDMNNWEQTSTELFWTEIAPAEHVLQVYENDSVFLDALAGFVGGGINTGDGVIVIATRPHLDALEARLSSLGVNVPSLIAHDSYIPLEANEMLAKFTVDGWPDEELFIETLSGIICRAVKGGRSIRAFGEMVAILWAQGNKDATVHLELLWNRLCEDVELSLFCAYPKSGFADEMDSSMMHICNAHSHLVKGSGISLTEMRYQVTLCDALGVIAI